jgi:hypothetical protein
MMFTLTRRIALVAAMLWVGFGVGGSCEAGPTLPTPAGLNPGDTFRFVFVTPGITNATSSDIADYNAFVNAQAGGAMYNGSTVSWDAIASTATVNAIDNVGQTNTPVYLANGTLVTPNTTATGLWSGTLLSPIDQALFGPNDFGPVWTGTKPDGTSDGPLGDVVATLGNTSSTDGTWVQAGFQFTDDFFVPLYGISQVLTVSASVPEPSTLLIAGTAISVVAAVGRSRQRRGQRWQNPLGRTDMTG